MCFCFDAFESCVLAGVGSLPHPDLCLLAQNKDMTGRKLRASDGGKTDLGCLVLTIDGAFIPIIVLGWLKTRPEKTVAAGVHPSVI
jgi:hypothetical protein